MNILILGGTGFIGTHLIKRLISPKNSITCLVRKKSNVDKLKKLDVKICYGDITDINSLKKAVKNQDLIYDLIGIGSVDANSKEEFTKFYNINVKGTKNILDAIANSKSKKLKKIIYLSSTAAVGLQKKPSDENTIPHPKSPYQKSKYLSEKLILSYYKKYKLPLIIIRPSMVYGANSRHSEILRMCKFIKKGIFPLFNNGKNFVPLIYVEDFVSGTILVAQKGRLGEIYQVTNEKLYTMNDLVKEVESNLGKNAIKLKIPKIISIPIVLILEKLFLLLKKRPFITIERIKSMTTSRIFKVDKLKKLGFKQKYSLKEGIKETVQGYLKNNLV